MWPQRRCADAASVPTDGTQGQYNMGNERKIHQCQFCLKVFCTPSLLKRHLVIHTGERPFKCNKCDRTFQQKAHLTNHYGRVHVNLPGYSS